MDPLSVTASIIAVLQLTTSVVSYLNGVRNASPEQKKVAIEASQLSSLLTSLRFRVEDARSDDEWFNHVKLLGLKDGPLDQLKVILEKMATQTNTLTTSRKRDRVMSALSWTFTKLDVDAALEQMERLKSLIQIALSNDAFKLSQVIHNEVMGIATTTREVHLSVQQLQSHADRDLKIKLSNWLQVSDPSTNYYEALKKRHPGTGSWLLTGKAFQAWKSSRSSLLWLHGKPGCGKTVLSATVLENVLAASGQPGVEVGYFYFDFNDLDKRSSSIAIRSLLFQLALKDSNGLRVLRQLYQECGDGKRQPTDDQIRTLLLTLISQAKRCYIVLDALDECQDCSELLAWIDHQTRLGQDNLCMFVISRRERDIDTSLKSVADHIINVESAKVDFDIDAYIRACLDTDKKLQKWPTVIKEEIVTRLMEKANGMFRWVYCQLEALRKCYKRSALRKTLSELPKDLDGTYSRILQSIESTSNLANAITILRWLCFSDRPLRLSELVDVLAIEYEDEEAIGFDPAERMPDPGDILEICSSLISFHTTMDEKLVAGEGGNATSPASYTDNFYREFGPSFGDVVWVRLAHFSVKEYLLSDRCPQQLDFQPEKCHTVISESCLYYLQYLSQECTLSDALFGMYPLADYTAHYWWQHLQKATGPYSTAKTMTNLIHDFLTNDQCLSTWSCLYDIELSWIPQPGQEPELKIYNFGSPIYYAAQIGVPRVIEEFLKRKVNVNAKGGYFGSALCAASRCGHKEVVQMLIDAGATVNAQEGHFGDALQVASYGGHEEVVQMLIDAGATVNAQGGYFGNALQAASYGGHKEVVQMLIDAGADVNAQGGYFGNALQLASEGGHKEVVQILIDAGADLSASRGYTSSALQLASASGHEKVVQMLIAAGADINACGGCYGSALQAASTSGKEKVAQMLIDAGADVNAYGGCYSSALEAASAYGYEKVVQCLIAAGADVIASDGGDALRTASMSGHKKVVQLLIEAGVDVNARNSEGQSALGDASKRGQKKIVQMLKEAGAK